MSETQPTPAAREAVAIVGLAGRFPRCRTLDEFWAKLVAGEELVTFFTDAELVASGVSPETLAQPNYVKARAVLEDAELFDASFFGINPREAELLDPQQRLFLECAWESLENAGYDPGRYAGAIGVYAGLSMNSYLFNNLARNPRALAAAGGYQLMLASDKDFLATRAAYKLDLHGPAVTVQTACSTSLVAVQMACQSLLAFQCDMALAGGVSVSSPRAAGYEFQPGMIMSPDGHCRAFDAQGRGIVAGEGVGLVVLKRLSEALADGDTIHAVIKGAAINNDGAQKVGYTAPSVDGQAEVIALAHAMAGFEPETIGYVEAHGTGTELGDPIEVAALTQAFGVGTVAPNSCALGSVKTNMGHLDAAAGIAGLLKTVLALQHAQIPPSLHFEQPNPNIDFARSPFYVPTEVRPWPTHGATPRRAGVSSFGIGGTNAHVVLEEAPAAVSGPSGRPSQLVLVSARTTEALESASVTLAEHLTTHPELDVADVAYTTQVGRRPFAERRAVVVGTASSDAAQALLAPDRRRGATNVLADRPVAFLFPGQGAQYVRMAHGLYAAEPTFRAELDRCATLLQPDLGLDLRTLLFPAAGDEDVATQRLQQTAITQPALFAVEYALARLWLSWGIEPAAMLGHSIGEYVAACLAGVFTLENALALVAARGRLMQNLPAGDMLAVPLPEEELVHELGGQLSLAAVNAPRLCVASGPGDGIQALRDRLESRGVNCRTLHTSHAFHSAMMDPVLDEFRRLVANAQPRPPTLPFVSNVTGTWITDAEATDPAYWATHLRSTVRFAAGVATLAGDSTLALLEVGPGQTLSSLARQHPDRPAEQPIVASLRHPQDPAADHTVLLGALGQLWTTGVEFDWPAVHAPEQRTRVPLPTYPFERERFWVEPETSLLVEAASTALAPAFPPRRDNLDAWFYQPSWRRFDRPMVPLELILQGQPEQEWLVFDDGSEIGTRLVDELLGHQQHVVRVSAGDAFASLGPDRYQVVPDAVESYQTLLRQVTEAGRPPARVVHLWNIGDPNPSQARAFDSLVYLAQALGEECPGAVSQIDVVGSGVFDVLGDEPLQPMAATVLGPCRVIPQEYPFGCRYIDVRLPAEPAGVCAEILQAPDQPIVAPRGTHRWVPSFEQLTLEDRPPALLRQHGVYLITGGLGGVGLALAQHLARTVQARLVLIGRSRLPEPAFWSAWETDHGLEDAVSRRIGAVRGLEDLGADVLVLQADVTDAHQMRDAVARARARFGRLDGVVHAAGVAGGGIIALKTPAQAEAVMAPKVQGTLALAEALGPEPLDFLVLCSSFTSLLGGAGQVDYTAANAFLDTFAHAQTRAGRPTMAINWATWQEVGMAVDTPVAAHLQEAKATNLRHGVRTSEAQAAFDRVLANPLPQVVVSPQDLPRLADYYVDLLRAGTGATAAPSDDVALPDQPAPALHARPRVASAYAAPTTELESQIVGIWHTLLGIAEIGVDDSFFDLGGHSLLATQLLARIQQLCGLQLPLRTVFEHQTVAALAAHITSLRAATSVEVVEGEREEIEI